MADITITPTTLSKTITGSGTTHVNRTITLSTGGKYVEGSIVVNSNADVVVPSGSLKNSATSGVTYTELTSDDVKLSTNGFLYINPGWYSATKISLDTLADGLLNEVGILIISQPKDASIDLGSSIRLSVEAYGRGTLTYTWYFKLPTGSWRLWDGRTTSSFIYTPTADKNGIQIYCVISNDSGASATTKTFTLTFNQTSFTLIRRNTELVLSGLIDVRNITTASYDVVPLFQSSFTSKTYNGITYTVSSDKKTCTAKGTTTSGGSGSFINIYGSTSKVPEGIIPGRTYTVSYTRSGTYAAGSAYMRIYYYTDGNTTSYSSTQTIKDLTGTTTVPINCTGFIIRYYIISGCTVDMTFGLPTMVTEEMKEADLYITPGTPISYKIRNYAYKTYPIAKIIDSKDRATWNTAWLNMDINNPIEEFEGTLNFDSGYQPSGYLNFQWGTTTTFNSNSNSTVLNIKGIR